MCSRLGEQPVYTGRWEAGLQGKEGINTLTDRIKLLENNMNRHSSDLMAYLGEKLKKGTWENKQRVKWNNYKKNRKLFRKENVVMVHCSALH